MHSRESALTFPGTGLQNLNEVAAALVRLAGHIKVWLFYGEMGAGKTTLIKAIGMALGIRDTMSSPTFSIVNEYEEGQEKIYHFDFYRIKNETEAYDIGIEEYFDSGDFCFVEWPEKIPNLIPEVHAGITITIEDDTRRIIAISVHDGKKENRV